MNIVNDQVDSDEEGIAAEDDDQNQVMELTDSD